jgi:hypothetical protein
MESEEIGGVFNIGEPEKILGLATLNKMEMEEAEMLEEMLAIFEEDFEEDFEEEVEPLLPPPPPNPPQKRRFKKLTEEDLEKLQDSRQSPATIYLY